MVAAERGVEVEAAAGWASPDRVAGWEADAAEAWAAPEWVAAEAEGEAEGCSSLRAPSVGKAPSL
jgi:hypothetical protein